MKTLIVALFMLSSTILSAQETIRWEGGTPGNETNWNEARNWSGHQIPDEISLVVIKKQNSGHNAQPVITNDVVVAEIEIHSGAVLTISNNATLIIDGEFTHSEGLVNYGGTLINHGILIEKNIDQDPRIDSYSQTDIKKTQK